MMYITGGKERCVVLGTFLVENQATVRSAAAKFGISKSTVHKDVTEHLCQVNHALYLEVEKVLQKNKEERHIRGGEATKNKYKCIQNECISMQPDTPEKQTNHTQMPQK